MNRINNPANAKYSPLQITGESMNKKIPNGSYCLFSKDEGGSRNGKIVLVELCDKQDPESGSRYSIKEYISKKLIGENQWEHESIVLKPLSNDSKFEPIELYGDEINQLSVVGIFMCVL